MEGRASGEWYVMKHMSLETSTVDDSSLAFKILRSCSRCASAPVWGQGMVSRSMCGPEAGPKEMNLR